MTFWAVGDRYVSEPRENSLVVDVYPTRQEARRELQARKKKYSNRQYVVFDMFKLVKVR